MQNIKKILSFQLGKLGKVLIWLREGIMCAAHRQSKIPGISSGGWKAKFHLHHIKENLQYNFFFCLTNCNHLKGFYISYFEPSDNIKL
jgi:hypothetical protein